MWLICLFVMLLKVFIRRPLVKVRRSILGAPRTVPITFFFSAGTPSQTWFLAGCNSCGCVAGV
jgi:hypothetical protein